MNGSFGPFGRLSCLAKRALFGFLQPTDRIKMHNGNHTFFFYHSRGASSNNHLRADAFHFISDAGSQTRLRRKEKKMCLGESTTRR